VTLGALGKDPHLAVDGIADYDQFRGPARVDQLQRLGPSGVRAVGAMAALRDGDERGGDKAFHTFKHHHDAVGWQRS